MHQETSSTAMHVETIQAHATRFSKSTTMEDGTTDSTNFLLDHAYSSVSSGDPDTLHLGEARKQADWPEFEKAMHKEVNDFVERGHWSLVPKDTVPGKLEADVVNVVWSFKRKRCPTSELLKYKARLCAHGGQQTHGVSYWDTYAPVVTWFTL